jgi:hypothetical protein
VGNGEEQHGIDEERQYIGEEQQGISYSHHHTFRCV